MIKICERAYGKINLTLDVLGLRPDGYHDLKSVMQTVSLYDVVELELGTKAPWSVACGKEDIPNEYSSMIRVSGCLKRINFCSFC